MLGVRGGQGASGHSRFWYPPLVETLGKFCPPPFLGGAVLPFVPGQLNSDLLDPTGSGLVPHGPPDRTVGDSGISPALALDVIMNLTFTVGT